MQACVRPDLENMNSDIKTCYGRLCFGDTHGTVLSSAPFVHPRIDKYLRTNTEGKQ